MVLSLKKKAKENVKEGTVALKKEIGVIQGVGIVVGIIVGSGIFVSPVGVLINTQSVGLSFIMWLVTGVFCSIGAMVYAELGVTLPLSGGEYIYVLETFGPFLAFMALWITFIMIGIVSCSVNALVFAQYILSPFFPTCDIPKSLLFLVAILALLTLCSINSYKVSWSTKLSVVFTVCKVAALSLIVGFGCYYLAKGNVSSFTDSFENSATSPGALAKAFYQGYWAFAGWNYLNFLTGEMKNPARTLPVVIGLSLTLVTAIYLLANVAYLAVLSPFEMLASGSGSAAVAVTFASRCMGVMSWTMPLFVGASVFGSINGEVLSMSRLCFSAGENGHMPTILSMISLTNATPIPSILALTVLSILFLLYDDIFILIELTGISFTIVSAMAVSSLLHIRRTNPGLNKTSFKLPLVFPIFFLIVDVLIGAFAIYNSPKDALLCFGLIAAGIPLYVIGVAWHSKPRAIQSFMYKLTVLLQKVFNVVQQEGHPRITEVALDASPTESIHLKSKA